MEEVTKCRYIDCVDTREKEQILHELPVCDTGLCVRWLINSGHVELIGRDLDALRSMKFFVCNNHFTEDCYLSKGTLKENAVPSPHWSAVSKTLKTLKTRRKVQLNGQGSSMEEVSINQPIKKNVPSEFEVDQWCRTCATKKQNLVSMTTKGKGADMSLLSKLKLLIEIDDEDALPTKMCEECVDKLEQSFKFFQQIYIADNTLRHVFPNTRSNSMPRKPLYSLSEHMRKEQKEKEKEKEEEQQDRAPKVTRGIFRRGRGRPRSRGYAARARSRQRSAQLSVPVLVPSPSANDNAITSSIDETRVNESAGLKNEPQSDVHDDERQGDTVFSLLTDTCRSDEELNWSDVLKVMSHERYQSSGQNKYTKIETRLGEKMESKVVEAQLPESETVLKTETQIAEEVSTKEQTKRERGTEIETETETEMKDKREVVEVKTRAMTENEAQRIRCEFCEEEFKFRRQLQTHLLTDHSQLSCHMCTDCLVCYESESLLSKHRTLRHGERRYRCEHCQEEFVEKKVLKEHVGKCQQHDMPHYCCDLCGVTFASKQSLVEHMKNHGNASAISLQLDLNDSRKGVENETASSSKSAQVEQEEECSATLIAPSSMVATFESTTKSDEKAEATNPSGTVESNSAAEHGQSDKESHFATTCPDCDEQMQDMVELSIHRMRRHSVNRKDATCLLCDNKSFSSPEEYEQHVLDHCKRLRVSPQ